MAHQQESFLPFSSRQSLLLPKLCGKKEHPKTAWSSLFSSKTSWSSLLRNCVVLFCSLRQSCVILSLLSPQTPWPSLLSFRTVWYFHLLQNRMVYSLLRSRVVYSFLPQNLVVLPPLWLPRLGLNPSAHLGWKSLPSPWLRAWPQLLNTSMKPVKGYRYVK